MKLQIVLIQYKVLVLYYKNLEKLNFIYNI
jgi:hypothetical protein